MATIVHTTMTPTNVDQKAEEKANVRNLVTQTGHKDQGVHGVTDPFDHLDQVDPAALFDQIVRFHFGQVVLVPVVVDEGNLIAANPE